MRAALRLLSQDMPWPRSAPRLAATAVDVLGVFLLGIWLGGHPSWLPQSFRDAFEQNSNGTLVNTVLGTISRTTTAR